MTYKTRKLSCTASNTPLKSYCRGFDNQEAHVPHLLTWVNSYKSLSVLFSLLVAMFLPIYPFGCHSIQLYSTFWTKCMYSVEDYSSNIFIKLLSTYLQWVRNNFHFSQSGGSSLYSSSTLSARGCSCSSSSASSLVDCVWASPLPKWLLTISSSPYKGIINIYFNTLLQRSWYNVSCHKIYHSIYEILGWRKYHIIL